MKLKSVAIKGMIGLVVVVALCIFFSDTVKSITTPKVQLIRGTSGRFEDKIELPGIVEFEKEVEFIIEQARGEGGIIVDKLYVTPGYEVKEGDMIFTAHMPTYDDNLKKLKEDYNLKAKELLDLETANRKASKASQQNELQLAVVEKQELQAQAVLEAKSKALEEKITLPQSMADWKMAVTMGEGSSELKEKIDRAVAAKAIYDEAYQAFMDSYNNKEMKIEDEVFTYIDKRNTLIKEMDKLMADQEELVAQNLAIKEVRAPYTGYVIKLNVNAGDNYTGVSPAFTMNESGVQPLMRAVVEEKDTKKIVEGAKVAFSVSNDWGQSENISSVVTKVETNIREGKRYAFIELTEEMIKTLGPLSKLQREGVTGTVTYRAKERTTLLPASAVRNDGEGDYVFVVSPAPGNILQGNNVLKVDKRNVTVVERSDTRVSIRDDIWESIADREDRSITAGSTVMEYNQQ